MKCFLPQFPPEKAVELMKWFGYVTNREDYGFVSFVRSPMAPEARYPRFHASVCACEDGVQINIHLDQEDIEGKSNHQFVWTYRNQLVLEEVKRFETLFERARQQILEKASSPEIFPNKLTNKNKFNFRFQKLFFYADFFNRTVVRQCQKFNAPFRLWRTHWSRRANQFFQKIIGR